MDLVRQAMNIPRMVIPATENAINFINSAAMNSGKSFVKGFTSAPGVGATSSDTFAQLGDALANSTPAGEGIGAVGQLAHSLTGLSDVSKALPLAMGLVNPLEEALSKFGQTTQFGRNIGGDGKQELMFINEAGKHVGSRFYQTATDVQKALERIALPQGWQAWPREIK